SPTRGANVLASPDCAPHPKGGTAMPIAPTLRRYLDQTVTYDVIVHDPTISSTRTAEICHISGDCLAKGILLRCEDCYMLAVLPASHHIRLQDLRTQLNDAVELADEAEIV